MHIAHQGCQLHYWIEGSGTPILWIQGSGVHGAGWRPQIDVLSARYQCIWFDNRGMGQSQPAAPPITVEQMTADALAVMDAAGCASAHIVGHSLGGLIAQHLALTARPRVKSLSLLCTFSRGQDATALTPWMLWVGLRTRIGNKRQRRRAFLQMVMPPETYSSADLDALAQQLEPLFGHDLADQPPVVMRQLRAMARFDAGSRLRELASIPTLVLSGELDRIAPPVSGRALAAAIPGARYVELAGAGHAAPIHRAGEINALLAEHFAASEGSARSAPVPARPITPSAG